MCWCALLLLLLQEQSHQMFGENLDINLNSNDAFEDAYLPILRLHLMQTSKMDFTLEKTHLRLISDGSH